MTRYLLDTGPAQQFINNHAAVRKNATMRKQSGAVIGICVPVLGKWASFGSYSYYDVISVYFASVGLVPVGAGNCWLPKEIIA